MLRSYTSPYILSDHHNLSFPYIYTHTDIINLVYGAILLKSPLSLFMVLENICHNCLFGQKGKWC